VGAALIVLLAAAVGGPAPASAGPASASAGPAPASASAATATPAVEIAIAALAPASAAVVREDLQDLLARRGVAARYREIAEVDRDEVLRPAAAAPCALACIWIDLGVAAAGRAFVYISATASEQVVIRSLSLPAGVDEVAREEVARIVASSVEALQAGRPLPTAAAKSVETLAKTERPAPPPAPAAPDPVWIAAGVGAGAARDTTDTPAAATVGLSLLVGRAGRPRAPALWLQADGFSSDAGGAEVALRFRGGALAVLGAVGTSTRARTVARLALGPGVELRAATPSVTGGAAPDGVALAGARLDPSLFVRAAARFEVRLGARAALFAVAACDARVVSHRYTVVRDDGTTVASYEPDRFRPSILVGLDARFAGGDAP
jgi:hypothetical protein